MSREQISALANSSRYYSVSIRTYVRVRVILLLFFYLYFSQEESGSDRFGGRELARGRVSVLHFYIAAVVSFTFRHYFSRRDA